MVIKETDSKITNPRNEKYGDSHQTTTFEIQTYSSWNPLVQPT